VTRKELDSFEKYFTQKIESILNETKEIIAQSKFESKNRACLNAYTSKSSLQNDSKSENRGEYVYNNDNHRALRQRDTNKHYTEVRTCKADDSRGTSLLKN
jgi:hypothetical protein